MNTKNWKIIAVIMLVTILAGWIVLEQNKSFASIKRKQSLSGTWKLISSKIITNGKTEITFPVKGQDMIKMFNESSFAFFKHDVNKGTGENAIFESGSGSYSLDGSVYKEFLQYCNSRAWENHEFVFNITLKQDTIVQRGIEKIDSLNINHEIVETYVRIKK